MESKVEDVQIKAFQIISKMYIISPMCQPLSWHLEGSFEIILVITVINLKEKWKQGKRQLTRKTEEKKEEEQQNTTKERQEDMEETRTEESENEELEI